MPDYVTTIQSLRIPLIAALLTCGVVPALAQAPPLANPPAPAAAPASPKAAAALPLGTSNVAWTGDLDGMIKRRRIRVLTTYNKTGYFIDKGVQRGITFDAFKLFEDSLNAKLKTGEFRSCSFR
jgi:hypothetical protein